jgi:cbb3-type cytochrome oxidase subunit 3
MKQAVLSNFDLPWIPLTGLILFVVSFTIYTLWTLNKKNKSFYQSAALIPLDEATKTNTKIGGN